MCGQLPRDSGGEFIILTVNQKVFTVNHGSTKRCLPAAAAAAAMFLRQTRHST